MSSIHQTKPTLTGHETAAWKVDPIVADPTKPLTVIGAGLDSWIVYAGWSHPFWPYHVVTMISLKDHPGVPPAVIRRIGATHELSVFALNPDFEPDTSGGWHRLEPINFTAQLVGISDEEANSILFKTVEDVVEGRLNPDTDGIKGWISRFGSDGIKLAYRDDAAKGVH